jgi:NAD-dependent dihydropyrimidine dehydrogenase PreA subunit
MAAEAPGKELHGIFIRIDADESVARDPKLAAKLEEVCPVDIFATDDDGSMRIVDENLDECVLCELCIEAAPPGTVRVHKLYNDTKLER